VFGTWYDGDKKPSAYGIQANGVPDHGYDEQPVRQLVRDTLAFYRQLGALLRWPVRKTMSVARPSSPDETPLAGNVAAASAKERISA